eukprot:NODE_23_length_4393_cov_37.788444_g20_i0.p1 GENE.NODE_23_length_4393_cov_37.788444_g20_i0~~NODE_23_length_4393_cov_37.788444_g20_i0.p1  ORF type:complete len:252 (-),score=34.04 NODE_23_length_4393_cov_37.788444_g20_i0:1162-1917(-)
MVKYINWNAISQGDADEDEYVTNMPSTKVVVYDTVELNLEATVSVDETTADCFIGGDSLPIGVMLETGPNSDLKVTFTVDTQADYAAGTDVNSGDEVVLSTDELAFGAWDCEDSFTVSVSANWNNDISDHFYVNLALAGEDAAAFELVNTQILVTVLSTGTTLAYTVTGDFVPSKVEANEVEGLGATTTGPGTVYFVVLPASRTAPTADEIVVFTDGEADEADESDARLLADNETEQDETEEEEGEEEEVT